VPFIISDVSYVDLNFCGTPKAIATGVYGGDAGVVLVDPGPGSCIDTLRGLLKAQGIAVGDIQAVLVTHIHLDHAGATGLLVEENPKIRVFVHEKGAPHMVDPSKLISSANQLWGEEGVARLWGKVLPVPQANLQILGEHDRIVAGGHAFDVRHTPGHASHHVSYFDEQTGIAWAGDTAGLRFTSRVFTLPPTPPPDIDLEAWRESIAKLRAWRPEIVFITHFGSYGGVNEHLDHLETSLRDVADMAKRALESELTDEAKYDQFKGDVIAYVHRALPQDEIAEIAPLEHVGPLEFNWRGLVRYWRKRGTTKA
jgi:glyoxylase-like metal-dependent hydrolase (beta-lactamase superfamily II)